MTNAVSKRAGEPADRSLERQMVALLLDLSNDKAGSLAWASRELPGSQILQLSKSDLKWRSKLDALAQVRKLNADLFAVFTSDLTTQSGRAAITLFGVLAGARRVLLGDGAGATIRRSRLTALSLDATRLVLEFIAGYLLIVPLTAVLTELLLLALPFRKITRASRSRVPTGDGGSLTAVYVNAAPGRDSVGAAIAGAGGMFTHVTGFLRGASRLGHRFKLLTTSPVGEVTAGDTATIPSSNLFSATRALFELWNNLRFTALAVGQTKELDASSKARFIYQRYSRFNWTGVALSVFTGLPFALEFNGSEVWMSRNWDPVGMVWLLKRFEKLNLRAADRIFVVSDVERRNLLAAGLSEDRIVVNPNGVDVERFKPGCGGAGVRAALGVGDRIVVGFVGTFGPWHGGPVLAQAVGGIREAARHHFLFVGDGDGRSEVENIIDSAGKRGFSTFVGRVPHTEVPSYLDGCDILVTPNVPPGDGGDFFGSPTKLFEYMAMAKPVVASRVGQLAEVIQDDANGLLVEPGDPRDLARAIERLAQDEPLRVRLGAAARQTVVNGYTWMDNAARVFDSMRPI